jgi:hypothetical protein
MLVPIVDSSEQIVKLASYANLKRVQQTRTTIGMANW